MSGRRVRTLVDGSAAAGLNETAWDRRDDAGGIVPAGAYAYRIDARGHVARGKLTIVR
jgi:hypothetical protein